MGEGNGYAGECLVCGWVGSQRESHNEAEEDAAEHAGYCKGVKAYKEFVDG